MTWRPDVAVVLAAGLGLRMRPLSNDLPKPLLRLCGKVLIDHVLDRIAAAEVPRAVVNVHHKADLIANHLGTRTRPAIIISDERERLLDTGGGVKKVLQQLGKDAFLIHNSDSVWIEGVGSNLARLFEGWDDRCMDALVLLAPIAGCIGYQGQGDFAADSEGRIRRSGEREMVPFVYTGVSLAHPRLFAGSPEGPFSLNVLWDRAIEAGRAFGVRLEGAWMHIGNPEALSLAEQRLADQLRG